MFQPMMHPNPFSPFEAVSSGSDVMPSWIKDNRAADWKTSSIFSPPLARALHSTQPSNFSSLTISLIFLSDTCTTKWRFEIQTSNEKVGKFKVCEIHIYNRIPLYFLMFCPFSHHLAFFLPSVSAYPTLSQPVVLQPPDYAVEARVTIVF